jgi:hypothetical protein
MTKYIDVDRDNFRVKRQGNEKLARKNIMGIYKDVDRTVDIYPGEHVTDYKMNGRRIGAYNHDTKQLWLKKKLPFK